MIVVKETKSIYAYLFVFFAGFIRFFSILFGGFNQQDEAKISAILNTGAYTVAVIVLLILALIICRSSYLLKLKPKAVGYFTVLSVVSAILVIATDKLIS